MGQGLVPSGVFENELAPQEFDKAIAFAAGKAKILKRIVDEQKLSVKVNNNNHLRVEAWETIAEGYGLSCSTKVSELFWDDPHTKVIGAMVYATVLDRNGMVRGGADQTCFAFEQNKGDHTASQLIGMASTRAVSRALKQILSWVVVMAGYSATPYEEIQGTPLAQTADSSSPMICPLHGTEWFKRGKMPQAAHPIEGEEGPRGGKVWCNQKDVIKDLHDGIGQLISAHNLSQEFVEEWLLKEFGKEWKAMTPFDRYGAIEKLGAELAEQAAGATESPAEAPEPAEVEQLTEGQVEMVEAEPAQRYQE